MVNGEFEPGLSITAGSPTILRIVHAAGAEQIELEIQGTDCSINIIAWDGVYLSAKYSSTDNKYPLVAGGRVEMEVTCAAGNHELRHRGEVLLNLFATIGGTVKAAVSDTELATVTKPTYMADLTNATVDQNYAIHLSQGSRDISTCGYAI